MSTEYSCNYLFDMAIDDVEQNAISWLSEQEFYQDWQMERKQLVQNYPCIEEVVEKDGDIALSKTEHQALLRYLQLGDKIDAAQKREYYRFGHVHANTYRNTLIERLHNNCESKVREDEKGTIKSENIMKKMEWNYPETSNWLYVFKERLNGIVEERLKSNLDYQRLVKDEQKILDNYPLLKLFAGGETSDKDIVLSVQEQKAYGEIFSMQYCKSNYWELEMYMIGHGDLLKYLYTLLG